MPLALLVAALAVLLSALLLAAPSGAAWAEGGSVELGVSVESAGAGASAGGSVELSAKVKAAPGAASGGQGEEANTVYLGIGVRNAQIHQVSLVGYYCDERGDVVTDEGGAQKKETIEVQDVLHGGHATVPANLERTDDAGGKYWVDGWYAYGADGRPQKVDLASYEVTGGATLFCYWKKGYAVMLDPNNGADADGEPVFDGSVDGGESCVAVERDVAFEEGGGTGNPDGYTAPAFPAATRPGYVFKGWYWAEEGKADSFGRAELANAKGDPVASSGDAKGYDFFREHAGETLYAKWEVDPGVRLELEDARDAKGDWGVSVWFWPGRGYVLSAPKADMELSDDPMKVVHAEAGPIPLEGKVKQIPTPAHGSQRFVGWGYAKATVEGEGDGARLVDDCLVSCEGEAGEYAYALTDAAFGEKYVDAGSMAWRADAGVDDAEGAPDGGRKSVLDALAETAQIRVDAPFRVTFEKSAEGGGTKPYKPVDLEWSGAGDGWIESAPLAFENLGERSVYVSGVECVDAGAAALLPGGAGGKPIFSLHETSGSPTGGSAILFGYSAAGGSNRVAVGPYDADACIVLPGTASAGGGGPVELYYGLDVANAAFNRAAVAVGSSSSSGSGASAGYVASVANVKYTYSVVP